MRDGHQPESSITAGQSQKTTVCLFIHHHHRHVPENTQTQEVRLDARMKEQSKEDKELEKVHLFMGDWMT